jgi:hypothetical protein
MDKSIGDLFLEASNYYYQGFHFSSGCRKKTISLPAQQLFNFESKHDRGEISHFYTESCIVITHPCVASV